MKTEYPFGGVQESPLLCGRPDAAWPCRRIARPERLFEIRKADLIFFRNVGRAQTCFGEKTFAVPIADVGLLSLRAGQDEPPAARALVQCVLLSRSQAAYQLAGEVLVRVKRGHALLEKLFIEGAPVGKDDFRDKPLIPISGCPGKRDDLDPLFPCPLTGEALCLAGIILGRSILGAFLRRIDSGKPDALSRIKYKCVPVRTLSHGG